MTAIHEVISQPSKVAIQIGQIENIKTFAINVLYQMAIYIKPVYPSKIEGNSRFISPIIKVKSIPSNIQAFIHRHESFGWKYSAKHLMPRLPRIL